MGDTTSATIDKLVNASEAPNASVPDFVQNTAAVITTTGVAWSEKFARLNQSWAFVQCTIQHTYQYYLYDKRSKYFRHLELAGPKVLNRFSNIVSETHHLQALDLRQHRRCAGNPFLYSLVPYRSSGTNAIGDIVCGNNGH